MIYGRDLIDEATIHQLHEELNRQADIVLQWALMPDAHLGYTVPIGSVILAKEVVPEWVGVDIGCGVLSFQFKCDKFNVDELYDEILKVIPVGFSHREKPIANIKLKYEVEGSDNQLGTLGGGNHFIEIGVDKEDYYWLTVHSGSRGVGYKTAQMLALERPDNMFEIIKSCEFWAKVNRFVIVQTIFTLLKNIDVNLVIESVHNNVEKTNRGYLHRKGATNAGKNVLGTIPGSMGDGVYIVRGKGNPESLNSCSHGAGRKFSRSHAKATLDVNAFAQQMKGIKANVSESTLNESPGAYKNIEQVIQAQKDNVKVVKRIKPILNVKG